MSARTTGNFDTSSQELRRLGDRLVDLMIQALDAEQSGDVMQPISGAASRALFDEPLPSSGTSIDEVMRRWEEDLLPFARRNGHPRFFAYVCGAADPVGVFADAIASALNQLVTAWRSSPCAAEIEHTVIRWLDQLVGFEGGGGLLVSGGSAANLHAMACAVERSEAKSGPGRDRLCIYLTADAHVSIRKACRLLGGRIQIVECDSERQLNELDLQRRIAADRAVGLVPSMVCASAGTVNTGAVDRLDKIAAIAEREQIWYHIDGAYGAPAVLDDEYRWMRRGFSAADSLSIDPHKWLFAPADVGCVLLRDPAASRSTFSLDSEYTEVRESDSGEQFAFFDHGLEMTRRFRGLKVWSILKARGTDGVGEAVRRTIALRRQLDERVRAHPSLELLGSGLSVSCFRYVGAAGLSSPELDTLNDRIIDELKGSGFYLAPTTLRSSLVLRVCIVSFRTTPSDIDALVSAVLQAGDRLSGRGAA